MTLPPSVRLAICTVLLLAAPACQPQPAAVNGAAGIGDPYYPLLGNGGYDVQRYTLSLAVDPAANQLDGTATLEADATERLSSFNLDFQGLTVDAITVNGSAAAFSQQAAELTVTPRRPLPADRPFTTVVRYHGQPGPVQSAALDVEVGWFHAADGTINVWSEPDGASTWFPNNNHPRDKATYRFEITVPKPWIVAASGSLKETTEAGGQTGYVWEMDQPMASYLAAIEIDRYDLVTAQGPDGVAVRSYFPPDYPEELRQRFDALPEMIAYLSSLFGPYPFKDYGVVIADGETMDCTDGGADEIQTLSIFCPPKYMAEEAIIVHELAHQWFGDSVSLKSWQDVWLKEGMATYVEWLWGTRDLEPAALDRTAHVATIGYFLSRPVGQPRDDFLYDDEVYRGGALVFHALRREVGEDAFFKILRTYLERYRGGVADTDDFIAVAQEVSGRDLRPLFDAWLYSTKLPSFAP